MIKCRFLRTLHGPNSTALEEIPCRCCGNITKLRLSYKKWDAENPVERRGEDFVMKFFRRKSSAAPVTRSAYSCNLQ
jgi:hypothetical protein